MGSQRFDISFSSSYDHHHRDGPVEMIGRKHLFDTEMGQASILPETIDASMEGADELDAQNDREMFSVPDTSNSDFNPAPSLEHTPGIPSRIPSPYLPCSIDDSQDNARSEPLTEAPTGSKTRKRKPKTKELSPEDTDNLHLINLGMSPFMPAQDAMTNQNRLVRNETILARHVFRIQKAQTVSDSTNAQRVQDVYRVLADHKVFIEGLQTGIRPAPLTLAAGSGTTGVPSSSTSTSSIRSDPDFMELLEEQRETRKILDELNDEMARFSAFTRRIIDGLTEAIQRLNTQHAHAATTLTSPGQPNINYPPTSRPSTGMSIASSSSSSLFSTTESTSSPMNRTLPPLSTLNLKGPRTDSITSSVGSLYVYGGRTNLSSASALNQAGAYQSVHAVANTSGGDHNTHYPRINLNLIPTQDNLSREVYHDHSVNAIVDDHDAVQNVGLSSSALQSAHVPHGRLDQADVRFWKARR